MYGTQHTHATILFFLTLFFLVPTLISFIQAYNHVIFLFRAHIKQTVRQSHKSGSSSCFKESSKGEVFNKKACNMQHTQSNWADVSKRTRAIVAEDACAMNFESSKSYQIMRDGIGVRTLWAHRHLFWKYSRSSRTRDQGTSALTFRAHMSYRRIIGSHAIDEAIYVWVVLHVLTPFTARWPNCYFNTIHVPGTRIL